MRLVLTTLRCPDAVAPETREAGGGEFSLGRGPENSWVLPDPDRHLSKRHCVLAFRAGGWQVADLSTNGTYLNRDAEPIGQGGVQELRDGDRLRLGQYEIEVRLEAETARPATDPFGAAPFAAKPFDANPFDDDPFAPPRAPPTPQQPLAWGAESAALPPDFDPLGPAEDPLRPASQPDHSPATSDAFRPPSAFPAAPSSASGLPDDWDLDEPLVPPPAAPPPVAPIEAATPPVMPAAPQEPVAAFRAPEPAPPSIASDGAMAAFLRGAGVAGAGPADQEAAFEALGAAFRATVAGLRAVLIARAAIKGEFRIEQTMIRARGNNPLKFSADDDDALAALLGAGRAAGMAPAAALEEALRDIRLHEVATVAATQAAVRAMLDTLAPARIEATAGGGLLPMQRKARAFEAFATAHEAMVNALADDFDSVFGKSFARAYEQAMREATDNPELP